MRHELITEMDHESLRFHIIPTDQAHEESITARQHGHSSRRNARLELACAALNDLGGSATISELASAMGLSYAVAWALVRDLQNTGRCDEIPGPVNPGADGR